MNGWRFVRFLQAHRTIARLIDRGPFRGLVARRVWAEAMADPEFVAGLNEGSADLEAGRVVEWKPDR